MDFKLLHSYDKIDIDDVYKDIEFYNISNIKYGEDLHEYLEFIVMALYDDIRYGRGNYKAYISHNMNARVLMELRKTMIMPLNWADFPDLCISSLKAKTQLELKQIRAKFFKQFIEEYEDCDWQYWYFCKHFYSKVQATDFYFDWECCFQDSEEWTNIDTDEYREMWVNAHLPKELRYYDVDISRGGLVKID